MPTGWWLWMQNRGPQGYSAPFLTLDKFRVVTTNEFVQLWGTRIRPLHYWRSGTSYKYFDESELRSFEAHLLEKLNEASFLTFLQQELLRKAEQFVQASLPFAQSNIASESALRDLLAKCSAAYHDLSQYSVPLIFAGRALETVVNKQLSDKLGDLGESLEHVPMYRMLMTRTDELSWPDMERRERQVVLAAIQSTPNYRTIFEQDVKSIEDDLWKYPELDSLLENHVRNWCWLHFKWIGPVLSRSYFIEELVKDLNAPFSKQDHPFTLAPQLLDRLQADESLLRHCHALRTFAVLKERESGLVSKAAYYLKSFRQEIARRYSLDESLTEQMVFDDYGRVLETAQHDWDEIERRKNLFLWLAGDRELFLTGYRAEALIHSELGDQPRHVEQKELHGTSAYPGQATGRVLKVTELALAMQRAKRGDVLVCYRTTPAYTPMITLASAILTVEKGLTQHAVMVARDLGKPCIVGIEDLMEFLREGEYVRVDATKGRVTRFAQQSEGRE